MKLFIATVVSIILFSMLVVVADEKSEIAPPKVGDPAPILRSKTLKKRNTT